MESFTTGSVRPRRMAITGLRKAGRNWRASAARRATDLADAQCASQRTNSGGYSSGAWLIASVPPASTRRERPAWMLSHAVSSACKPEAQLRITVHAGTFSPHPRRKATTRPMFASSGEGMVEPTITSSKAVASKGWRSSSARPQATARSEAVKAPGPVRARRNGVRAPSTTWTRRVAKLSPQQPLPRALRPESHRRE